LQTTGSRLILLVVSAVVWIARRCCWARQTCECLRTVRAWWTCKLQRNSACVPSSMPMQHCRCSWRWVGTCKNSKKTKKTAVMRMIGVSLKILSTKLSMQLRKCA
jgi:hypothetical protein